MDYLLTVDGSLLTVRGSLLTISGSPLTVSQSPAANGYTPLTWQRRLLLVLEVATLPGLDEFCPGGRVEKVHWRDLPGIGSLCGNIAHLYAGCLAAVAGGRLHECAPLGGTVVLAGQFYIVGGNFGIGEVAGKLLGGRAWTDDGDRQVGRVLYHQLHHAILVAFQGFGDRYHLMLVAYVGEVDHVAFEYYDGKNTLVVGDGSPVRALDGNAYGGYAYKAVCRHHDTVQLHHGILDRFKLGVRTVAKQAGEYQYQG